MQNIQPIEKREFRSDGTLSVHSIFETIQGEGPFCGMPCVFVRLAGCNLQCPACDTDYTSGRSRYTVEAILESVTTLRGSGLVVITGGEPFRQDIRNLCWTLHENGFFIQIESNGTLQPDPGIPWASQDLARKLGTYLVVSPKTGKLHPDVYQRAHALKYVVQAGNMRVEDGLPLQALEHTSSPYPARPPEGWDRPVYVQPMDETFVDPEQGPLKNQLNYTAAVKSCLRFGYTLQVQVHKIVGVA